MQVINAICNYATTVYFCFALPSIDRHPCLQWFCSKLMDWFASWHQDTKNPERNQFKKPFPVSRKKRNKEILLTPFCLQSSTSRCHRREAEESLSVFSSFRQASAICRAKLMTSTLWRSSLHETISNKQTLFYFISEMHVKCKCKNLMQYFPAVTVINSNSYNK